MKQKTLLPFAMIGAGWLLVILIQSLFVTTNQFASFSWGIGLWLLSVFDLVVIAQLVAHIIQFVGSKDELQKLPYFVQIGLWLLAKLVCLFLFGIVLQRAGAAPTGALLMGLGTMVIVPFLGGLLWSNKELKNARGT